jgi:uncharacterized protein YjbJ (UPF0337 family)
MSNDQGMVEWAELKGKIKSKWSKLVDTDVDSFKGNMHLIADKVQAAYGYSKDRAQQEYSDFKKSLDTKGTGPEESKQK